MTLTTKKDKIHSSVIISGGRKQNNKKIFKRIKQEDSPSTGKIRTLNPGNTANSSTDPFSNSSSGKGNNLLSGCSVEYTHGTPDTTPNRRRRSRTARASGSYVVWDISPI